MKHGLSADDQMGGAERAMSLFDDVWMGGYLNKETGHYTHPFLTRYAFQLVKLRQCDSNDPLRALGRTTFALPFPFSAAPESSGLSCHGRDELAMVS